jgi:sugar phosphate permease
MHQEKPQRRPRFYYGWTIVAVVGLVGVSHTAETLPILSVFLKPVTEEFGWTRSAYTGSIAVGTAAGSLVAVYVGPKLDRFGSRWILVGSLAVLSSTFFLMSWIENLWQFYALQIIGRMVQTGIMSLAITTIVPKWFVAKLGRAVAIAGMGNKVGHTFLPWIAQQLVRLMGWRPAYSGLGVMVLLVSMVPAGVFLRRRPEDMGLLPDGAAPQDDDGQQEGSALQESRAASRQEVSYGARQVLRMPSFYLLTGSFALFFFINPSISLHAIPYLTDQGISTDTAVAVVVVWSATGVIGSFGSGFLAERLDPRKIMAVQYLLVAAGYYLLLNVSTTATAFAWGAYYGVVQSGIFTLQNIIVANYYGRETLGAIRGIMWPVQALFNAVGPMAASVVFDVTGAYVIIFNAFIAIAFAAAALVFMAQPPRAQRRVEAAQSP